MTEAKETKAPSDAVVETATNGKKGKKDARFSDYVYAGFPDIYLNTKEGDRAIRELSILVQGRKKLARCIRWDIAGGLARYNPNYGKLKTVTKGKTTQKIPEPLWIDRDPELKDPVALLDWVMNYGKDPDHDGSSEYEGRLVVFAENFHHYLAGDSHLIPQMILNAYDEWKAPPNKTFVVVAPTLKLPDEVEKTFTVLDFDLPTEEEMRAIIVGSAASFRQFDPKIPEVNNIQELSRAAIGLTMQEAENALALSITTTGMWDPRFIVEVKRQLIKKTNFLELSNFTQRFSDIKGYDVLKEFLLSSVSDPLSKGVIIVGQPGCGKTHLIKALGNEMPGYSVIKVDVGNLLGSYVGESEEKARNCLKIIVAMAPCIVIFDEIEKGFSGMNSSGQTDSGVMSHVGSLFLDFLQDRPANIYCAATCNSITGMPMEMTRAGRWDAAFYVDFPNKIERPAILDFHKGFYGLRADDEAPNLEGWSGSEIQTMCRLAAIRKKGLKEASNFITPLSEFQKDQVEVLRRWAKDSGAINASTPLEEGGEAVIGRRVMMPSG